VVCANIKQKITTVVTKTLNLYLVMLVFNLSKSSMHSHYYCIGNEKCQHASNTWVLQTLQLSATSIAQCQWHCYTAVLLIIPWIHDLLHRFHLSVSRSCWNQYIKMSLGSYPLIIPERKLLMQWSTFSSLTLSLLMLYIYGAPSKARNFNIIYIWTYIWQR